MHKYLHVDILNISCGKVYIFDIWKPILKAKKVHLLNLYLIFTDKMRMKKTSELFYNGIFYPFCEVCNVSENLQ